MSMVVPAEETEKGKGVFAIHQVLFFALNLLCPLLPSRSWVVFSLFSFKGKENGGQGKSEIDACEIDARRHQEAAMERKGTPMN